MAMRALIRIGSLVALAALAGGRDVATAADSRAAGIDPRSPVIQVVASEESSRPLSLGIGKSVVLDLPRDIKDVLVADPLVANAVVRSSRRAYLIGVKLGQTNVYFFDAEGRQIAGFDITIKRDLGGLREILKQTFPALDVRVEPVGDGLMLTGSVATPGEAQQVYDLASRVASSGGAGGFSFGGGASDSKVINNITVRGRDQVMLKVTVAEVQRDVIKQLGIDLSGQIGFGSAVLNFNTSNPFSAYGQSLSPNSTIVPSWKNITGTIRAMERAGVIRTLAEPSLTAISGETATFIAGGEFPVPNGLSCDTTKSPPVCQQQVDFKKFGISLNFSPVVLSEGRISLKVMTEASDLSTDNAITLGVPGTSQTLTIPSIRTRRADTVVEIPSGGALALAGMIQEQTKQAINGLPGLMQLPVLGALFKSRDYVNRQTELMILVTPYIVRAVAPKDLSKPDDGFADPADPSSALLGRLNRLYGTATVADQKKTYHGNYGFILD